MEDTGSTLNRLKCIHWKCKTSFGSWATGRQAGAAAGLRALSLPAFVRPSHRHLPPLLSYRPMPGGYGVMGDDGAMDYSVHEAWNEATTKLRNGKRGRGKGKPETAGCLCALCGPLGNLKIKMFFLLFERV